MRYSTWLQAVLAFLIVTCARAEGPPRIVVQAGQPGAATMRVGVFFEDINYGADGGLYPEKVKNRSFEFDDPYMGWTIDAASRVRLSIRDDRPIAPTNTHYLHIEGKAGEPTVLSNEGFFGVGVKAGEGFTFSVFARGGGEHAPAVIGRIVASDGRELGKGRLDAIQPAWQRASCEVRASATDAKARFVVELDGPGSIDLDMVSLFPHDTWKNRPNGLRADMVQRLADLHPAFMRFPGGCIVEGHTLANRYQWKTTIGPLEQRKLIKNRWNDEFKHRPAPDYYQSFGLGFFEYFQLCEDIGASPLPILNCGMACQFNSGELVPLDQLEPYIQDALDLIEFANGPASSVWGARRAEMGHPEPFHLTMLGIGNEQWGPGYMERYERFARAIQAKYPEIALVSSAGPRPDDDLYQFAWSKLPGLGARLIDEHCYDSPAWFLDNAHRYDSFDPKGPQIFMGEYAAQSVKTVSPDNRNDWRCALAEAAYLTGLQRNSAVVQLSSYAPLFGHEEGWQWRPNLIWLDNLTTYGTPSYYVQQLFAMNGGDAVRPVAIENQAPASSKAPGLYASSSFDRKTAEIILVVVNSAGQECPAEVRIDGAQGVGSEGRQIVLRADRLDAENSVAKPLEVAPKESGLSVSGPSFRHAFPSQSVSVLRIPLLLAK